MDTYGLETENQAFGTQEQTLQSEASHFFTRLETSLTSLEEQFDHSSTRFRRYLDSLKKDVTAYDEKIQRESKRWYAAIGKKITDCEKMLLACDPRLKLKQGFSIVKDKSGNVLKSKKTIAIDDIIQVELSDGFLDSKVEDIR